MNRKERGIGWLYALDVLAVLLNLGLLILRLVQGVWFAVVIHALLIGMVLWSTIRLIRSRRELERMKRKYGGLWEEDKLLRTEIENKTEKGE